MPEILDFLKMFGGFVYLLMGGELLVRGALGLSRESRIPTVVVGMTVVAMGTSAPELVVSGYSALAGYPSIAVGNVVGSNIANVLLVLGVPALIYPISCAQEGLARQTSLMIAVSLAFIGMMAFSPISFVEGLLLLATLAAFLLLSARGAGMMPLEDAEEQLQRGPGMPTRPLTIGGFILLGAVALPLGADLVVEGGIGLAGSWGVPEAVIGLSLIALGTSLPELSTTVIAALHRSADVAIGNVIGSNLFNILAILGVTALLTDIPVAPGFLPLDVAPEDYAGLLLGPHLLRFDLWVMLASSLILWGFVLAKGAIGKFCGLTFLAGYFAYMYTIYHVAS